MNTPLSRDATEEIKVYIAAAAAVLVILRYLWHRFLEPRANKLALHSDRGLKLTLALLALFSVLNYSRYHPTYVWVDRVDAYDLTHYYLNAKYFEELSYDGLYPAVILADNETGGPYFNSHHPLFQRQDAETGEYYFQPYVEFQQDTQEHDRIRADFGPERWEEFKHDFTYLQREVKGFTPDTWEQMLWDHGFNGAPSWVLFAEPLANLVPVESVKLLCWTDGLWLLTAMGFTWWAFGYQGSLWLAVFFFTTYSARWPTLTWAFGRDDYMALLVIATCLIKKNRYAGAGAAVAVATAFRVFPAAWLYGPAFKGAWTLARDWLRSPRVWLGAGPRRLLKLAGVFFAVHLALWGAVSLRYGPDAIERHFANLFEHTTPENLSSMRQGFALATAYVPEEFAEGTTHVFGGPKPSFNNRMEEKRRIRVKQQAPTRKAVAITLMILLGVGLRRAKDHEAFAMGFVPFFLMATASYYYYIVRAALVVMHGGDLARGRNAAGLALLFAIEAIVNGVYLAVPKYRVIHIGTMGWCLVGYCVLMIAWFNWEAWRAWRAERVASLPSPAAPAET